MKILMISSFLPYPLHSGGHVRLFNLIRELSEKHEITLICEKRKNQTKENIEAVEKICKKVVTVERRKQWSVANILKSFGSSKSFLVTGHTHNEMQEKIKKELGENKYDLIHVETFYVMQNLPETSLPIILAEHNIEYLVYRRFVAQSPFILRPILSLDVTKIRRDEEASWKKATKLVAVSEDDRKIMEETGLEPVVISNGVNTEKFSFKDIEERFKNNERRILFIGDFKWIQNRDAAKWIIKEIFPLISSELDVKLWIVGRKIPDNINNLTNDPSVLFDEESSVLEAAQIFQKADILLAPIRIGGGTSYKILESMSCGTPVVTTPLSADAIMAKNGEEIMVGQTAQELAEKAILLLSNKDQYEKISKNGRKLIEEKYTWKKIAKELEKIYQSTI